MNKNSCSLCIEECSEECTLYHVSINGRVISEGKMVEAISGNGKGFVGKQIWQLPEFAVKDESAWEEAIQKVDKGGSMFLRELLPDVSSGLALKVPGCPERCGPHKDSFQLINGRIFSFCRQSRLNSLGEKITKKIKSADEPGEVMDVFVRGLRVCASQRVFYVDSRAKKLFKLGAESLEEFCEVSLLQKNLHACYQEGAQQSLMKLEHSFLPQKEFPLEDRFRYYLVPLNYEYSNSFHFIIGFPYSCHDTLIIDKLRSFYSLLSSALIGFLEKNSLSKTGILLESRLERSLKEGRIATWNWNPKTGEFSELGNFFALLGCEAEELLRLHHEGEEIVPVEDKNALMKSLNEHISGEVPYFFTDFRMRHKMGHFIWFHAQGKIVERDENGQPLAMTGTLQDISEKVEMDQSLRQSQKMEAIGSLASGISHDFNNLLQVILGNAEIMKDKCFDASIDIDEADAIIDAGEKAMVLVRQLLSFSRIQEQAMVPVNFSILLPEMIKMVRAFIGEKVEIIFENLSEDAVIDGDPVQIEQLLVNLCVNSRDAMPDGGQVKITADCVNLEDDIITILGKIPAGSYVTLCVSDEGCGIDSAVQDRIFEPFYTTRDVSRGTGLGLAMVYSIIKKHNAYVRLKSEPGHGTSFFIYFLPSFLQFSQAVSPDKDVTTVQRIDEDACLCGDETILIAEDDPMVRRLACKTLAKAGYNVVEAEDGQQALELFASKPESFDLVILDMIMPEMDGKQAYAEMQVLKKRQPVIFASGFSSELLHSDYLLQVDGKLLEKPYRKHDLLQKVRDILNRAQKTQSLSN